MKEIVEKFEKGKTILKNADYFAHMVYPLMKEKRLLQKLFSDLNKSCKLLIEAILIYESKYKRISNSRFNFDIFKKVAKRFEINREDVNLIEEILNKSEEIKESQMDFVKKEKYVAMRNKNFLILSIDEIINYLKKIKEIYFKVEKKFKKDLLISKYLK